MINKQENGGDVDDIESAMSDGGTYFCGQFAFETVQNWKVVDYKNYKNGAKKSGRQFGFPMEENM